MARTLVAVVACIIVGCGDNEPGGGGAQAPGSSEAFPVSVTHKFGSTQVPQAPQRIVAVGYNDADFALTFGAEPLAIRAPLGQYEILDRPWVPPAAREPRPEIIPGEEINFEQVAAQRPDLILAVYSGITRSEYETLSRIAPTIAQTGEFIDFGMPWQQQTQQTGRALGQEQRARQIVADVERQVAEDRRALREFKGATVAVTAPSDSGYFINASADLRVRSFTDLGLRVPAQVDKLAGDQFFADISREQIDLLDQDLIIVLAEREKFANDELFQRLDAVREGRVIYIPEGDKNDVYGALAVFNSPLSIPFQIRQLVPRLEAALDGDPSTEVAPLP